MKLVIDHLACRRGGRLVFRDLSLDLPPGRAGILRGPNGVGKSTLLRVIAGFVPAASGDVRMGELTLGGDPAAFRERVAYAGHLDAVKPMLTVAENLEVWAALHGTGRGRAEAALARFGLLPLADRPAGECSAGQKRRLGLARLLVTDRPLWLLDEPTVSLDTAASALVAELVAEHLAGGGTALAATHVDLGLADPVTIEMTPPAPEATREADPFLGSAWAEGAG